MIKSRTRNLFSTFHCSQIEYEFEISRDIVRLDAFKSDVARIVGKSYNPRGKGFSGSTTTRISIDYHAHFSFRWDGKTFKGSISYYPESVKPSPGDLGPFTENLMEWIGGFIKNEQISAELSAYLSYPMKRPQASLPMPMKLLVKGYEVEVFGMLVKLPAKPNGVKEVFTVLHDDKVSIGLTADKLIYFKDFHLNRDLSDLSAVVKTFVGRSQNDNQ